MAGVGLFIAGFLFITWPYSALLILLMIEAVLALLAGLVVIVVALWIGCWLASVVLRLIAERRKRIAATG